MIDADIGTPTSIDVLDRLSDDGSGFSTISYGELFEGAFGASDSQARLAKFHALLDRFTRLPLSDTMMEIFSGTRAQLRRTGPLRPAMRLPIAGTASHPDITVVARGRRHFEHLPDLALHMPG